MPGFCIFYIETNEKDFDYEKATLVIYGNMFGSDDMLRYISIALCVCGGIRYVGFSFLCITSNLFSNEEYFIFVSILFTS